MTSDFDFMANLFREPAAPRQSAFDQHRAARQLCDRDGHHYQVHGKTNPTKLTCSRCNVSWAIGARTEPAEAAR